jgi:hypothetical protein
MAHRDGGHSNEIDCRPVDFPAPASFVAERMIGMQMIQSALMMIALQMNRPKKSARLKHRELRIPTSHGITIDRNDENSRTDNLIRVNDEGCSSGIDARDAKGRQDAGDSDQRPLIWRGTTVHHSDSD